MADIDQLRREHELARLDFEGACLADYISHEDYEAIRKRYHATMKAYHDAAGYGFPVSTQKDPS
jgi:hypothetical protein